MSRLSSFLHFSRLSASGVFITLLTVLLLELLRQGVVNVAVASGLLILVIFYTTFRGGLRSGAISAILGAGYLLYFFSNPGQLFSYNSELGLWLIITLFLVPLAVLSGVLLRNRFSWLTPGISQGETRYRLLFENTLDGMMVVSPEGTIEEANPAICTLLGYELEELLKLNRRQLLDLDEASTAAMVQERLNKGAGQIDLRFIHRDGTRITCGVRSKIFQNNHGQPRAILTVRDIRFRLEIQEKLRNSEEQYRTLARNIPGAAVLLFDQELRFKLVEGIALAESGYSPEAMQGKTIWEALPSESAKAMAPVYQDALAGKSSFLERVYKGHYYAVQVVPLRNDQGEITGGMVFSQNVTNFKKMEAALSESEAHYRSVVTTMTEGVVLQDKTGQILTCNSSAEHILGLSAAQMMGRSSIDPGWQAIHEDGSPFPGDTHPAMVSLRTGQPCANVIMGVHKPDETLSWVLVNSKPIFESGEAQPYAVVVSFADITQLKQAEEQVRQRERFIESLTEASLDIIYVYDLIEQRNVYTNRGIGSSLGYSPDQIAEMGQDLFPILLHPDDLAQLGARLARFLVAKDGELIETEYRMKHANGQWRWLYSREVILNRTPEGTPRQVFGIAADVTLRKEAQNLLEAEKERLAVTLHSIGDAVITTDNTGKVVFLNPVAEKLTGWRLAEAIDQPLSAVFNILDETTRQPAINPLGEVIATGKMVTLNHTVLFSRQGTEFNIADSAAPIWTNAHELNGVVLVFRDITQEKKLNEELVKASRLESLGLLAGGIAHDFNNLLTGIVGSISLARLNTDREGIEEALVMAEQATMNARELTRQLLTFAKGGAPIKKVARLEEIARETATFTLHGSKLLGEYHLPATLWPVEIDTGQLGQVIQNLVINAIQAMPAGGKIVLRGQNVTLPRDEILPLHPGRYVKLSIQDEGVGIAPEYLERIFDPYFTTKPAGSGLGLASCYSIIKRHDGYIKVESRLGYGTTFYIYLPASAKEIKSSPEKKVVKLKGSGRVLVMDDEKVIRTVAARNLTHLGYEVETVADGVEALASYKAASEARQPFDVVIMDLTIPGGMGGSETIGKLLEYDPQARVIVSSGYSNDAVSANYYSQLGFRAVVSKPYSIEELVKAINELMPQCNVTH